LLVLGFQVAALEVGQLLKLLHGGLELLLGGLLLVAAVLDAIDEDVAFGPAEFLPGGVVGASAADQGAEQECECEDARVHEGLLLKDRGSLAEARARVSRFMPYYV